MKPVAVFRHSRGEGPGYFATFLERRSVPWQLVRIDAGDPAPATADEFSGLCFMGGPMSVNDDLAWLPRLLALISDAVAKDIPVIGHCLGGQLMAKALGGTVVRNSVKEIGWGRIEASDDAARDWLGDTASFLGFHWHGETFSIPDGATRILSSPFCGNQAFVLGPHLAMQCHVEMTETMIGEWAKAWPAERAEPGPSVQTAAQMLDNVAARVAALHGTAERLYARWIAGVKQG